MAQFLTELWATPEPDERWRIVDHPLIFMDDDKSEIAVPVGFTCDLASIPFLAREIMGKASFGDVVYAPAAVLHDYLLDQKVPSAQCHKLFKKALLACGASEELANIMYIAVNHPRLEEVEYPDDTQARDKTKILS